MISIHKWLSIFSPPVLISIAGFFIIDADFLMKVIIALSCFVVYFILLSFYHANKIQKLESKNSRLENEKTSYFNKIARYGTFQHEREMFLKHDLEKISQVIIKYNGFVKNEYRGRKFLSLRKEADTTKEQIIEIINKEKRKFDDDIHHVQSDKNN